MLDDIHVFKTKYKGLMRDATWKWEVLFSEKCSHETRKLVSKPLTFKDPKDEIVIAQRKYVSLSRKKQHYASGVNHSHRLERVAAFGIVLPPYPWRLHCPRLRVIRLRKLRAIRLRKLLYDSERTTALRASTSGCASCLSL